MATVSKRIKSLSGLTGLKIELSLPGSNTVANNDDAFTEDGSTGYFEASVEESLSGLYEVTIVNASGVAVWEGGLVNMDFDPAKIDDPTQLDGLLTVGAVAGAVGSVTGAVGSVTGNVGGNVNGNLGGNVNGNVVGSVASVAGAVGSVSGAVGSVTGDVGGKVLGGGSGTITGDGVRAESVTGAVGSVTGAVGSVTGSVGSVAGSVSGDVSGDVQGKVLGGGASSISGDGVRAASVTGAVGSVTGNVGGNVAGSVGSVVGAVGSVTGGVTVTTNNDKAGYSLATAPPTASAIADAVLEELVADHSSVAGSLAALVAALPPTIRVKKNTALAGFAFPMVDSSDVPATGLTVAATRSLDGGSFASCANAVSEISGGGYKIDLAASDLNANTVLLRFAASGAKTLWVMVVTQP